MKNKKMFLYCSKCHGRLIERLSNGMLKFVFGGRPLKPGETSNRMEEPPIIIRIHGSVSMKCFRTHCRLKNPDHWNTFTFFPESSNQHNVEENTIGNEENPTNTKEKT